MNINFQDKLAICYVSCGPTYRESLLKKLNEKYFDHENLYYFILTDDKSYFRDLPFKNLCVKESYSKTSTGFDCTNQQQTTA